MAKTDYRSIDEYLANFPNEIQEKLETIRQTIHAVVPGAKEVISYQIPCFSMNGPIVYFSAFKNHIAVAAPPPTIEVFKDELSGYKTSLSVFQIPYDQAIPKELISKIVKYRAAENEKKPKTKK